MLVHVVPGASRDSVVGEYDGRLKISVTAPPEDGKANKHLIRFLAKSLGLSKGQLSVETGETSRKKALLVQGVKVDSLLAQLDYLLSHA